MQHLDQELAQCPQESCFANAVPALVCPPQFSVEHLLRLVSPEKGGLVDNNVSSRLQGPGTPGPVLGVHQRDVDDIGAALAECQIVIAEHLIDALGGARPAGLTSGRDVNAIQTREILDELKKRHVRFLLLQFTDLLGVNKAVEVPSSQFERALGGEVTFDGSALEGFARVEEADALLVPDLETFRLFPWESGATAPSAVRTHGEGCPDPFGMVEGTPA